MTWVLYSRRLDTQSDRLTQVARNEVGFRAVPQQFQGVWVGFPEPTAQDNYCLW